MSRNTTLTEELAAKLEFYWQLVAETLTDEQIAHKLEISFGQLRGWLQRNVKPKRENGERLPVGLRDIRARAKAGTVISYLVKISNAADRAAGAGKEGDAIRAWTWLLERQFPKQYGQKSPQENDQQKGPCGVALLPGQTTEEESERNAQKLGPQNAKVPAQEDKKPCAPDAPQPGNQNRS